MKIITQLKVTGLILLLAAALNLGWVYFQIDRMKADSRVVNFSGIVRGATQRVVKLEISSQPSDGIITNVARPGLFSADVPRPGKDSESDVARARRQRDVALAEGQRLDKIVNGLIDGDRDLRLPPATDRNFLSKLEAVKNAWIELQEIIQNNRQNLDTANNLLIASENYWDLTNAAVFAAEDFAKDNVNRLKLTQIIIFLIHVILLGFIVRNISTNISDKLIKTIRDIRLASTELAATVEQQERAANQQASAVHQTTVSMDELGATSRNCAEEADVANSAASSALFIAKNGYQSMVNSRETLAELTEKIEAMQEQIVSLKEGSDRIERISVLASNLAKLTKVLALNATVEAARAERLVSPDASQKAEGENRKGFAVVAREIRKLADESQESAKAINGIVVDIKSAVQSLEVATNRSRKALDIKLEISEETARAFNGLTEAIDLVVLNNKQISLNTQQQAIAIQQVVIAMNSLNQGATETAAGIAQVKLGARKLKEAASNLKALV